MRRQLLTVFIFVVLLALFVLAGLPQQALADTYASMGMTQGFISTFVWTLTNLYGGSVNGHVFRYAGGTAWTDVGSPAAGYEVNDLFYNYSNVYAGCENGHVCRYDGGTTWTDVGVPGSGSSVHALDWNSANIFAGCSSGHVYRYDGGTTWTDVGTTGAYVATLDWNGVNLFAGCLDGHVYRYDGGTTWTDTGNPGAGSRVVALADNTNTLDIVAGCENGHVYRYNGSAWADLGYVGKEDVYSLVWYGSVTNLYAGCLNGHVYRYDAGTWTDVGNPGGAGVRSMEYNGANIYAGCNDGHVHRFESGTTWTDVGATGGSSIKALLWNGTDYYAGSWNGHVYRYIGYTYWEDTGDTGGSYVYSLAWNGVDVYAGCADGHVYRYDGGTTWTDVWPAGTHDVLALLWNGTNLYAGCYGGHVFRYEGGTTWTDLGATGAATVWSLGWSGTSLYAGGNNAHVYRCDGVNNWADVGVTTGTVSALFWTGSVLYAGCASGHVCRYDGGTTWTDVGNTGSVNVNALGWNGVNLFAGGDSGHVYRYGGGTTWTDTGDAGGGKIFSFTWDGINLYTGCDSGVFRRTAPKPTITSVTPNAGTQGTTVHVTELAGADFYGSAGHLPVVLLRKSGQTDIVATNVNVAASNRITCDFAIPSNAGAGPWDLRVTNPDNQHDEKTGAFTVNSLPPPPVPQATWYLAEGDCTPPFSTYISIQNPNSTTCHAAITYMKPSGKVSGGTKTLPPYSQTTINPASVVGSSMFSTQVFCKEGKPIAVDRTMSWTAPGASGPEGHSSVGVTAPAKTWYLPEGSSAWGFSCLLSIMNPNSTNASVNITYMIEGASPVTKTVTCRAYARSTYDMASHIGARDASIRVTSNLPVVPERSMYRNSGREGHNSIGTTAPASDYYLAEGTSAWGFTTYVLVQNPNTSSTRVDMTFMTNAGPVSFPPFTMPANSRKTVRVNDFMPGKDFSTRVHGSHPIIAERAMYWNSPAGEATHDSIGLSSPHATFYLPDGQSGGGYETWTLVQNPNASTVSIRITYMKKGGGTATLTDTIPANSRKTYPLSDKIASGRASSLVKCTTSGKKIMVERAMYWSARDAGTDTIGGFSD